MSRLYRVIWEIEVEADSPEQAARQCRAIQVDPNSTATVFDVEWEASDGSPRSACVDLDELDCAPGRP